MEFREFGEHFPVEVDFFLFQHADEPAVRGDFVVFERANAGIDFNVPQSPEVAFLVATMSESIRTRVYDGFISLALFRTPTKAISFGLFQDIFSRFIRDSPSFYSGHGIELFAYVFGKKRLLFLLFMIKLEVFFPPNCFTRDALALKWFLPPLRTRIFPFFVTRNLFEYDLFDFILVLFQF